MAVLAGLALLWGCSSSDQPVQPSGAYFLWAGVRGTPAVARAHTVYLLAGEVRAADPARLIPLRATPRLPGPELWLTVRVERLDWGEGVYRQIDRALRQWEQAGNRVAGLQVDFDAATRGLADYRAFLTDLRSRLPARYRLSITGLLDWSAHGDPAALAGLAGTVDEVVIQTYQGRHTIPGYDGYLRTLSRLPMPFRVGVVADGQWREPPFLRADPDYHGTVEFLLRR